jgi:MFS family permease
MLKLITIFFVADYYQGAQRTQVMGQQAAFMGLGGVLFLLLSGFLAGMNWRLPFAVYLLSWLILPLVILALPEPQRSQESDPLGTHTEPQLQKLPVKTLALVYFLNFAAMLTFYMTPAQLPFYQRSLGVNQSTQVGFAIAATTLTSAMASMGYSWLKAGTYGTVVVFLGLLAIALQFLQQDPQDSIRTES